MANFKHGKTQIIQGLSAILSVLPMQAHCPWLLWGMYGMTVMEPLLPALTFIHLFSLHTSQFLFNLFFHFPAQALAVWSYVIFCHTGHVSSLSWSVCSSMGRNLASCKSLISFLSLLQNSSKKSSHLSPPFPLLLYFSWLHQNRAEDDAGLGNKLLFSCEM